MGERPRSRKSGHGRAAALAPAIRTLVIDFVCTQCSAIVRGGWALSARRLKDPDLGVVADQEAIRPWLAVVATDMDVAPK